MKHLTLLTLILALIFTACNKSDVTDTPVASDDTYTNVEYLGGDDKDKDGIEYTKHITKPLVKPEDCQYITEGTIEFILGDAISFVIDFGDGECDNIATKTEGDMVTEFTLDKADCKGKGDKKGKSDKKGDDCKKDKDGKDCCTKNVIKELVYLDDCDYPVAGTIQFIK
ncbi:hypothetical protein ACFLSQ_09555, partial [Bacteroidota bacterium]